MPIKNRPRLSCALGVLVTKAYLHSVVLYCMSTGIAVALVWFITRRHWIVANGSLRLAVAKHYSRLSIYKINPFVAYRLRGRAARDKRAHIPVALRFAHGTGRIQSGCPNKNRKFLSGADGGCCSAVYQSQ
ncbi:hypothetical protein B0J17DRAFT_274573 [Rhizoctonia solani]|nr:hypothetical protein B0J17DRAFT_274573 [Rhizoctonia solani]